MCRRAPGLDDRCADREWKDEHHRINARKPRQEQDRRRAPDRKPDRGLLRRDQEDPGAHRSRPKGRIPCREA